MLLAAGAVGFGHAVLPDHWVPLALLGRTRRYPLRRVARLSGLAGVAHVLVSVVLGALIVAVGLQLRARVEHVQDTIVGLILVATGAALAVAELTGLGRAHRHAHGHAHADRHPRWHEHGHAHHDTHARAHGHAHSHSRITSLAAVMVPFGAAASPDLTILPVFLAASATGAGTAIGSLLVFAAVTIGTIVALTVLAAASGYRLRARWLDRWGNAFAALVLIAIGALVLAGVL